ncbi:hypothetical protein NE237_014143 [Protea cynaroides]|uniref:Uncharacterized protein n=1 Tax=Protea cynaroides TaxID=273540 RepID=A0A9Q0H174_9MAGN|nr:hypothetical protein NE237_014143 [Protea cynaroides]
MKNDAGQELPVLINCFLISPINHSLLFTLTLILTHKLPISILLSFLFLTQILCLSNLQKPKFPVLGFIFCSSLIFFNLASAYFRWVSTLLAGDGPHAGSHDF